MIEQPLEGEEGWLISDFFFEDGEFACDLVHEKVLDLIDVIRGAGYAIFLARYLNIPLTCFGACEVPVSSVTGCVLSLQIGKMLPMLFNW